MTAKYNVFDLPQDLLDSLRPFSFSGELPQLEQPKEPSPSVVSKKSFQQDIDNGKVPECSYCGVIEGSTAQDLRAHYKKDYHRFNIKRKQRDQPPVTEAEFEKLADSLDEEISGSEDSASDESSGEEDDVANLVEKTSLNRISEEEKEEENQQRKVGSPYLLFTSDKLESEKCLGVYKALVDPDLVDEPVKALNSLKRGGQSAVFMIGGGHFSGAIIKHAPGKQKPTATNPYAHLQITHHKGFHRYTTRRKQGGSQAGNDNAGGHAKSAGSTLRRYNEQALQQEIRELLAEWRSEIDKCDNVYIRANGKHNRAVLMSYDGTPFKKGDKRVKGLPLATQRATATEIKRAWLELITAKVVDKPLEEVKKPVAAAKPQSQPKKQPVKKEVTAEEKHTLELTQLIKKSRSPRITAYLKTHKLTPEFELQPAVDYVNTPTALFYAAAQGSHHVVSTLLVQLHADPTIRNDAGRTAYDTSVDRQTKDAFQMARAALGEAAWDWSGAARVGPALTKQDIDKRQQEEKLEEQKERQEQLDQMEKHEHKHKLDKIVQRSGQGRKLANSVQTELSSEAGLRGLSDEARMRLERERRARAAEARFAKKS